MTSIRFGSREIGDGFPPLFVAELGTCHNGSVEVAKVNATAAVAAGADCVKTELFYETEIAHPSARKTYEIRGRHYECSLIDHMRECQLTLPQHREIKEHVDTLGVPFMATAHDFERVDFMVDIGAEAVKIASPDIVHVPLIRYAAKSGLTLFLDTGGAYQHEVEMAVRIARDAGCERLVVNHNPAGHPAPAERHDLRIIQRFKELFGCPVGIADHYDGYEMAPLAVAVGANVVEKPVSEDRFIEKCEHIWAVSRADLPAFVASLRTAWLALGHTERQGTGLRMESPHRVALVANRKLAAGEAISLDTVRFGKPRLGIGVEHWDLVEGWHLLRPLEEGAYVQWTDIAPVS